MDSQTLARYIESIDGISKPWLLGLLRLKKLQEKKEMLTPEEYEQELAEIHQDLMNLGEWWVGIEDEVFGSEE
ncbi:MAG: hypothetical protein NZ772_00905 [Cyanobacteria bacterium]|nr:hypothetical protein [Cyanobacteriota bacterium]MDW8199867.1 hypothetical protein [Cyanobacteriota bacterium SKYGB_h_bin112]